MQRSIYSRASEFSWIDAIDRRAACRESRLINVPFARARAVVNHYTFSSSWINEPRGLSVRVSLFSHPHPIGFFLPRGAERNLGDTAKVRRVGE